MKVKEKEKAKQLRLEGKSVKEIADELSVSKSSVSLWTRDIVLSAEQVSNIFDRASKKRLRQARKVSRTAREKRISFQNSGRQLYRELKNEEKFIAGCALYWAEGSKERGVVALANSDANLLQFFMNYMRSYFNVDDSEFSLYCRYYTDLVREGEPEEYWAEILGLPKTCLRKSTVDYYVKEGKTRGKLKYGVCSVRVCSTEKVQMIYGAIKEMAGIEDDRWL